MGIARSSRLLQRPTLGLERTLSISRPRERLVLAARGWARIAIAATAVFALNSHAIPATLVVPGDYPTIQAAIDAAAAGDSIAVKAGTYVEQLRIDKDLVITGAGMDKTIVKAPASLSLGNLGDTSIVEIFGGARAALSRLTVSGPGSGTCSAGALNAGVRVHSLAHLDMRFAAVRNIHDSSLAPCGHSGTAILVGDIPDPTATLHIEQSEITRYQSAGIVVLGFGSVATITHNTIAGPGAASGVATDGIEFPVGAVGTITHNKVSGNGCPPSDSSCGPDWFTQFQHAGILAGGWGPGTVVSHNVTTDNQIGIFLGEVDEVADNHMIDSQLFGLGVFDGTFVIDGAQIKGGAGGIWAVAQGADTRVVLQHVTLVKLSGPAVEKLECCGFTAVVEPAP